MFQLLLKECTIEARKFASFWFSYSLFQLLLKECTIEAASGAMVNTEITVSVVIERMYD